MYYDAWCFLKSMDDNIGNGIIFTTRKLTFSDKIFCH